MTNSSEGFLDIIGLKQNTREIANLKVIIENPSGEPDNEILSDIFDFIKKVYGTEKFTILWWDGQYNPSIKRISPEDIDFLQNLWLRISGNYLLFLPVQFDLKQFTKIDEEEFIGLCLIKNFHLILKSPDAYEILYLTLNG